MLRLELHNFQVDQDQRYKQREGLLRLTGSNGETEQKREKVESNDSQKSRFELEREETAVKRQREEKEERDKLGYTGQDNGEVSTEERYLGYGEDVGERTKYSESGREVAGEERYSKISEELWGSKRYSSFRRDAGEENRTFPGFRTEVRGKERQYSCFRRQTDDSQYRGGLSEEKEAVGETLYYTLASWYPHLAPRLTGMLLQMDLPHLVRLVADPDLLRAKAKLALAAIDAEQQQNSFG